MSVGDFAGGFAEAFQNSFFSVQDRKARDAIAKQQAKLIEMQLKAGKLKLDAQTKIADLMTGMPSGSEQLGAQNQMLGQQIQQEAADPNMAIQEIAPFALQGDSAGGPDPMGRAPMGLPEMLADPTGQLALVNAGWLNVGDLLDFEQTKIMADQAGNFDFNEILSSFDPKTSAWEPQLELNSDGTASITLRRNENLVTPEQLRRSQFDLDKRWADTQEVMDYLATIEGGAMESGSTFGGLAREAKATWEAFKGELGLPQSKETKEQLAAFDSAEKLMAAMTITDPEAKILMEEGGMTNAKLQQVQAATASLKKNSVTNARVILEALDLKLQAARLSGNPAPNEAQIKAYIDETLAYIDETGQIPGVEAPQQGPMEPFEKPETIPVDKVMKMSEEQLDIIFDLMQQGLKVTKETLDALEARDIELNSGR